MVIKAKRFHARGKRMQAAEKKSVLQPVPVAAAISIVKAFDAPKFDQSVELIVNLGIDPRQADQMVRSSVSLPHGVGKTNRVICFCDSTRETEALNAGAIRAGGQELVEDILKNNFTDFDVAVATPDQMRFVGRLGKLLGPKGLMPSPKAGTVTQDIKTAIKEYIAGRLEFRNDAGGNIHTIVGKVSFDDDKLQENIQAMLDTVIRLKPSAAKGLYMKKAFLKATMTPAVPLSISAA
ncbi:MAG: 50S ribosomal protein L1 [Phycisphaerae bacterium]